VEVQAAVDCYGAYVTRATAVGDQLPRTSIVEHLADLSCPLLGLFGAEDPAPTVDEVAELEAVLKELGKSYQFHIYENAGHAFFSVDSAKYRTDAALDGWEKVCDWFSEYLARPATS
jgi:carboxymethylenebutenolidase